MSYMENTFGDKKLWEAGRRYERERIIKLLEERATRPYWDMDELIAEIEGENGE